MENVKRNMLCVITGGVATDMERATGCVNIFI